MSLNSILIDTNICLDVALNRQPFVLESSKVLETSEENDVTGWVSAHSFDTIFYILSKTYNKIKTYNAIAGLRRTVQIANVTQRVIDQAIHAKWDDFEDAIHYQAAMSSGCNAIVTRNESDFEQSELPVYSPQTLLDQLDG